MAFQFETRPFNLGNTLAQTAQIQNFRSINKLREAQLKDLDRQNTRREALTNTLSGLDLDDPGAANQLARAGFLGVAQDVTSLQSSLAQLEGTQLDNALDRTRIVNNAARSIENSADPVQAALLAMKDPVLREIFPNIDPTSMTPEALIQAVSDLRQQTDFINDPAAISEIVTGPEAIELGLQPGTVAQRTTQPSGQEDIKILQQPPKAGQKITINPDGTVTFSQGGPAGGVSKPTQARLEASVIELDDQLSQLKQIKDSFEPEFQQVGTRIANAFTRFKDKFNITVSKEEIEDLQRFSLFKRNAISALNLYIKLITGAQMSEAEADRLRQGFPDPGEGIFDGDSPAEYQSKFDGTLKQLTLARSRRIWVINNGRLSPDTTKKQIEDGAIERIISIDIFEATLDARAEQLTNAFIERGMNEQTARQQALTQVKQEFSL